MKNPGQLLNVLGKLFVFAFAWSMGGTFKRQEDGDDDDTVNRRGADKTEREVNICFEFDNFVREVFEIEPPLGEQIGRIGQIVLLIIISCWITNVGFFILLLLNRTSTW